MERIFAKRMMIGILSISLLGASLPSASYAGMIGTQTLIETQPTRDARARVKAFISQDSVQAQLIALGADPADVQEREPHSPKQSCAICISTSIPCRQEAFWPLSALSLSC